MAFLSCRQCPQMDLQRQNQRSRCWWVWNGYGFPSRLHSLKYPLQRRIRINSQIHLERGKTHAATRGLFFLPPSGLLVSSSCRGAKLQRIAEATISFPLQESCLGRRRIWKRSSLLLKVAKNRKATISFSLRQRFHFLIRKSQDFFQRSTHQKSFGFGRNGEGRRVSKRKKFADRTTFKQI